jgi:hypothetical protein
MTPLEAVRQAQLRADHTGTPFAICAVRGELGVYPANASNIRYKKVFEICRPSKEFKK